MEHKTPFDGQQLLDSFREFNNSAIDMLSLSEDEQQEDLRKAIAVVSETTAHAAQEAEDALKALEDGNPLTAKRYLNSMAYVMSMVSLATHEI